jgi:RNA polymerase sigma-70 factor (ECF subfamily)
MGWIGEEREAVYREWMAAAQRGDSAAYERLLTELLPLLRSFVRGRIPEPSAVEDVVQNVLLAVHRARHTYRAERRFSPWMRAVARNAVTDYLRSRQRRLRRELPLDAAEPVAAEADPGPQADLSPEVREALAKLPAAQREAVELIQLRGLSVAEAAAKAGVKPGALKVRAHRGYRALRLLLGKRGDS